VSEKIRKEREKTERERNRERVSGKIGKVRETVSDGNRESVCVRERNRERD